jgi:hypothetical protein
MYSMWTLHQNVPSFYFEFLNKEYTTNIFYTVSYIFIDGTILPTLRKTLEKAEN